MTKENKHEAILVLGAVAAVAALAFVVGVIIGSKKKKQMVVNESGKLVEQEVDA